jgi:hypothetical protein
MPLDPNIILSGLQQQRGVDMNALVQQQISGMENINTLERQRRADDLVMQDRAAAAQKEQEAAAIKALLPAYTYGIQTGDIAGAGKLVPPEMQGQLQPFIDALAGASPQEVQSALIGSLSSSPEGQEALAAIQRAKTAEIQMGQLGLSRERLAFDVAEAGKPEVMTPYQEAQIAISRDDLALRRQKQALDARGEGEWELKDGVDENGKPIFVWTNPRTRQIVKAEIGAGAPAAAPGVAPGPTPIPAPDVIAPRQPALGVPEAALPAAAAAPPAEFRPKPKTEKASDLTEREGKSVNFAIRMADSDAVANELERGGILTTDTISNFFTGVVSALPMSTGANLASQLESAFNAAMPTMSPEEQRLAVAQLDFVTAILRSESGAEIKTSEFPAEYRKYFAVAGDENNPKLLADKKRRRQMAINGMKAQAGAKGQAEIDRILSEQGATAPPSAGTPAAPGATLEGFEYQGEED